MYQGFIDGVFGVFCGLLNDVVIVLICDLIECFDFLVCVCFCVYEFVLEDGE